MEEVEMRGAVMERFRWRVFLEDAAEVLGFALIGAAIGVWVMRALGVIG